MENQMAKVIIQRNEEKGTTFSSEIWAILLNECPLENIA